MNDRVEIAPQGPIDPAELRLSSETRKHLASALREAYDTALSDRAGIDEQVLIAERNYEMVTVPRVYPWRSAANVFIPIIPEQVDSVVAATSADVFVPSFFLVLGLTPQAAEMAHKMQRYYNAQLTEKRGLGLKTWRQEAEDFLHLAALHGTSYLDVTYLRRKSKKRYALLNPATDPETGTPVIDLTTGEQEQNTEIREVEFTDYDDVLWESLELRDIVLIPARAKSVEEADAVVRVMYYTENDLRAMAKSGLFYKDAVDLVLAGSTAKGGTERDDDARGTETYEVGGQVNATSQTISGSVHGRLKTTEYEVLRIDSRMFSRSEDGPAEHVIYFVHRNPEVLLGAMPFPYHHDRRTTVSLSLLPRPKRAYGYGIPERLRTIQSEINANTNQRRDQQTIRLSPPQRRDAGVKVLGGEDGAWGPNVTLIGPKDSVEILPMPDVLPSSEREEDRLYAMAGRIAGQSSLATGALASNRKTKAEVQAASRGQSSRQSKMSSQVRHAMAEAFYLTHELKKQYGPQNMEVTVNPTGTSPERLTLTKDELSQQYDLLVAGMGGPQDRDAARQDAMLLHQMFVNPGRPDIMGDPVRRYAFDRALLESQDRPDIEILIGTAHDAMAAKQQQQQAAMMQQQMAAAGGGPPQPGGKPGPHDGEGGGPQQQSLPGLGAGGPGLGA